ALAVQIWELANSFFDELEYLYWSRFTVVKSLYIWSRYVMIVVQIVNLVFTHKVYELPQRVRLCVATYVYKSVVGHQALTCIELILLIRVYALYNRSRRIKYFLCTAFLTNFSVELWGNSQVIRSVIKGNSCIADATPSTSLIAFGASASLFQGLILCMTLFKYVAGHHYGWARTPLTSLLLRQGIAVCFLTFGMVVVNLTYEKMRTSDAEFSNAAFAWYMSLLSVAGCRLILDMRKLAVSHPARNPESDEDHDVELTSNLNMST
ncbi:hypothetical protein BYT27DRAFT_7082978, partial [Phlegmacium glaucopus]